MSLWGPLASRYETNDDRPRRLLALDGGGIRGVLTLGILAEVERQLAAARSAGAAFRLCHFFDYIAGTSTGAIIAAGLARGMSVAELLDFYVTVGPRMFDKSSLFERWKHLYDSAPLADKLRAVYGSATDLSPEHLQCLLLVVTRNVTTDSPWPISNNPAAKYNDCARPDCNLRIPLWKLVRASTAAPVYFPPEVVQWDPNDANKSFVFVDGGMTPYNNPAFLLYRMATAAPYRLGWRPGEDRLMLVSIGTGAGATLGAGPDSPESNIASTVACIPGALMYGCQVDQDIDCRLVGRCISGAPIDREIGDLVARASDGRPIPIEKPLGRAFLYARYNADLSERGLADLGITDVDSRKVSALDAVDCIQDLRRIGRAAAARDVVMNAFGRLVTT